MLSPLSHDQDVPQATLELVEFVACALPSVPCKDSQLLPRASHPQHRFHDHADHTRFCITRSILADVALRRRSGMQAPSAHVAGWAAEMNRARSFTLSRARPGWFVAARSGSSTREHPSTATRGARSRGSTGDAAEVDMMADTMEQGCIDRHPDTHGWVLARLFERGGGVTPLHRPAALSRPLARAHVSWVKATPGPWRSCAAT